MEKDRWRWRWRNIRRSGGKEEQMKEMLRVELQEVRRRQENRWRQETLKGPWTSWRTS